MAKNPQQENDDLGTHRGTAAAARRMRQAKENGIVVSYAEVDATIHEYETVVENGQSVFRAKLDASFNKIPVANPPEDMVALIKKMNGFMNAIDQKPDNFDAIMNYGSAVTKKIGQAADASVAVQRKFDAQFNVVRSAEEELRQSGISEFVDGGKKLLAAGKKGAQKTIKGFGRLLAGIGNLFGGKEEEEEKSEERKAREAMSEALPKMMQNMDRIIKNMKDAEPALQQIIQEAKNAGVNQLAASQELALYISCKDELMRRYDEEYIPMAQEQADASSSPLDKQYLADVLKRKGQLNERIHQLAQAKQVCDNGANQLFQLIQSMEEQCVKVRTTIETTQPMWKQMIAILGLAASTLKSAEQNKESDDFSDALLSQNHELVKTAIQLTVDSKTHGMVQNELLIAQAEELKNLLLDSKAKEEEHQRQIDEQTATLVSTNARLIEELRELKNGADRTIDASSDFSESAAPQVASNDDAAPAAAAPKATRAKRNTPKNK